MGTVKSLIFSDVETKILNASNEMIKVAIAWSELKKPRNGKDESKLQIYLFDFPNQSIPNPESYMVIQGLDHNQQICE